MISKVSHLQLPEKTTNGRLKIIFATSVPQIGDKIFTKLCPVCAENRRDFNTKIKDGTQYLLLG